MADYRESNVQGTSYRRAFAVHLSNPRGHPKSILFEEEEVIQLSDREIVNVVGNVSTTFDANETFALIDPSTGEPTGATASHRDVYAILASLYLHLARSRDAAAAAAAPQLSEPAPVATAALPATGGPVPGSAP